MVAAASLSVRAIGTPVVMADMVQTISTMATAIGAINSEARRGGLASEISDGNGAKGKPSTPLTSEAPTATGVVD